MKALKLGKLTKSELTEAKKQYELIAEVMGVKGYSNGIPLPSNTRSLSDNDKEYIVALSSEIFSLFNQKRTDCPTDAASVYYLICKLAVLLPHIKHRVIMRLEDHRHVFKVAEVGKCGQIKKRK